MTEFKPYPKTPRLFRDMVVTEKIDGTNAAIQIERAPVAAHPASTIVPVDGYRYFVTSQSRKRIISPDDDNFGFARWVHENARELVQVLGEGTHFGEWWGSGIQRGYGLEKGEKRFSLFNVKRWEEVLYVHEDVVVRGLRVVPTLYSGPFSEETINDMLDLLAVEGSFATPKGFDRPEGIVVYHTAAGQTFKVLIENDDIPKGLAVAREAA